VVVSAAPTGEFDAPEDPSLWGVLQPSSKPVNLIVRPAHLYVKFIELIELLSAAYGNTSTTNSTSDNSSKSSNFYLEYFPMYAAFRKCLATDDCSDLLHQLPDYSFANFLAERYHLLWMGGGGDRSFPRHKQQEEEQEEELHEEGNKGGGEGRSEIRAGLPNSRMHFDRMENLMTVLTGSKSFYLYDPSQSEYLYGGSPVISASFTASITRKKGPTDKKGTAVCSQDEEGSETCSAEQDSSSRSPTISVGFKRDTQTLMMTPNEYHTYSPVNIHNPNITKYPKFSKARGMVCEVAAGDTLFVPSHWWHEVGSFAFL
jgi:hypothetical protein